MMILFRYVDIYVEVKGKLDERCVYLVPKPVY